MSRIATVAGRALPLRGQDIDTDRIMPARFLKAITFDGLEGHLFEDDRAAQPRHPFADTRFDGASILLVNRNFGCGSSREHAPQAIVRRGFRAIVGESFSEIFFGNAVTLGLPCVQCSAGSIEILMAEVERDPSMQLAVDLEAGEVRTGEQRFAATMPVGARRALLTGEWDAAGRLRDRPGEVEQVLRRLPYISGF